MVGGCALCHPRRLRCPLDGARGARQGAGGGVGDSSDGEVMEARVGHPPGKRHGLDSAREACGAPEGDAGQGA